MKNIQTTWGSKNAEDMFAIAVNMANFNPIELMKEIHKRSPLGTKVKLSTVENAMQAIIDRYEDSKERRERLKKQFAKEVK